MPFNKDMFLGAQLVPRTKTIPVPDLAQWFDGVPEWTVRGLTGHELGKCNEAAAKNQNIAAMLEALASTTHKDKVSAIQQALGLDDATPQDVAKRMEMLILGSVDPVCDQQTAVKLCRAFPVEFFELTNEITRLTGAGHELGKPSVSGVSPASETV